jgi:hypothetical protein
MVSEHLGRAMTMGRAHRLRSRAIFLTAVLITCSLLVLDPAGASPPTGSGERSAAVGAPASQTNVALRGVSCDSPGYCTAVGYSYTGPLGSDQTGGSPDRTLVELWNGAVNAWLPVTSPNASADNNQLDAISCLSTTWCTAVGSYSSGTVSQTLIEHWDGTAWSIVSSPNVSTTLADLLLGVTCTSAFGLYRGR